MKILLVGSGMWVHPIWRGVLQAVEELTAMGHEVLHCWMNAPHTTRSDKLRDAVLDFEPEVGVWMGCGRLGAQAAPWAAILNELKLRGIPLAWWMNDLRTHERSYEIGGLFTHTFLCWSRTFRHPDVCLGRKYSYGEWAQMTRTKVMYMPQGAGSFTDDKIPTPDDSGRTVFIGSTGHRVYHHARAAILQKLNAEKINFAAAGSARKRRAETEAKSPFIYRRARYCLSMSPLVAGYASVRMYNILSCGGLMLLHYFPESERLFKNGTHCIMFTQPDQAAMMRKLYDAHPVSRELIRRAGLKLQREKHTITKRVLNIVANMTTSDQSFHGWLDE